MFKLQRIAAGLLSVGLTAGMADAGMTYTGQLVNAQSVIYSAGQSSAVGGGLVPPVFALPVNPGVLTFSSVTGTITLNNGGNYNDPDGVGGAVSSSSVSSLGGISGVSAPHDGFLVGLFTANTIPGSNPPPSLDFTTSSPGTSFTSLSPLLDQTFFIGDGLTGDGTGSVQQFVAPAGATELYLGISDAGGYNGSPGSYGDNSGNFTANFTVTSVPEPASVGLIGAGLLGLLRRRRRA